MSLSTTPSLLIVEDSEDDLFFFRRLLKKTGVEISLAVATDGLEAIKYLSAALAVGQAEAPAVPRLILLDLKLPLKSGFEVLQWIRAQPGLARVPTVVLSSSAEARDVTQAFARGAQGYLVKHPGPSAIAELLRAVIARPADAGLDGFVVPETLRP